MQLGCVKNKIIHHHEGMSDTTIHSTRNSKCHKRLLVVNQLLQAGQASRPVVTDGRTDVFVVCDREGGVDAEVRNQLREQIRVRRLSRLAEGYLQDLRRDAVIERR